jgi:hypothetical protein
MSKLIRFWKIYQVKILLCLGISLVAILAFQAGYLKGKTISDEPMVIEAVADASGSTSAKNNADTEKSSDTLKPNSQNSAIGSDMSVRTAECQYVGSRNSNKFHLPSCQWAKRIKPENKVCFSSAEDAASKGYQPDKNCVK